MNTTPEPDDTGDLLHVSEGRRLDVDPDPTDPGHTALGAGGVADDVSDVPAGGDVVDPAELQE